VVHGLSSKLTPNGGNILQTAENVIGRRIRFVAANQTKAAFLG
jgi:hypothetical protein